MGDREFWRRGGIRTPGTGFSPYNGLANFPVFTAWCSESISYVRMRCPTMVQKTPVRQHLCNYCATQNFNGLSYRCTRITSANDRASYGSAISGAPPGSGHTSQYKVPMHNRTSTSVLPVIRAKSPKVPVRITCYALPITHPVEVRAVLPRLFPSRAVKSQRLYLLIEYFQRHF